MAIYNKIDKAFENRRALICYAPLGDPAFSDELIDIYVECGVDIIEVGIPSPNPYADGKVVTQSMCRSLESGMTMRASAVRTLAIHKKYPDLAKIWMCYEDAQLDNFEQRAQDCGLDGLLMVGFDKRNDAKELEDKMRRSNLHHISFLSFNTSKGDLEIAKHSTGYIFQQAVDGVTGAKSASSTVDASLAGKLAQLRSNGANIPIVLGFGISTGDHVRQAVAAGADGVVSGSACVNAAFQGPEVLRQFLNSLRSALDEN